MDSLTDYAKAKYRQHKRTIIACGITALVVYKVATKSQKDKEVNLVMTSDDARAVQFGACQMRYDTKEYGPMIVRSPNFRPGE